MLHACVAPLANGALSLQTRGRGLVVVADERAGPRGLQTRGWGLVGVADERAGPSRGCRREGGA